MLMLTLQDGYVQRCALILVFCLQVRVVIRQQLLFCATLTILQAVSTALNASKVLRMPCLTINGKQLMEATQWQAVYKKPNNTRQELHLAHHKATHHLHLLLQVCRALLQQLLQALHITSCCCIMKKAAGNSTVG
jgi:hypothetical protein